jgi:pimeloyl-ACP methyl ester carboxylesterase
MAKIKINGIELAYERSGKGPPLVLLHGFPLDHETWNKVAGLLEDTFDLILPDLRGFGESTMTEASFTMDDYASDIAGLLDHLGIAKTAIAGHSMGGYVALAFARRHPERVSALGLVSSQVLADPPDRKEGRYKTAEDVAKNGIHGVVEAMTPKFTSDADLQSIARETMERQKPAAFIGALKAMAERGDSTPLLPSVHYPVVLIHGDTDALISIDRAREVKAAVPGAQLVELTGVGHLPMLEATGKTAEALKFLA